MFNNKQVQRFSIRKLTVGAASVLIGIGFLSVDNNKAQAAETSKTDSDITTKADDSSADEIAKQKQVENAQLKVQDNSQKAQNDQKTETAATELQVADKTAETAKTTTVKATENTAANTNQTTQKQTVAENSQDKKEEKADSSKDVNVKDVTIKINSVDDVNGGATPIFNKRTGKWGEVSYDLKNADLTKQYLNIQSLYTVPGYKLLNPEEITDNFDIDLPSGTLTPKKNNINLTLHYAPLAPVKIEYVNADNGEVISSTEFPAWKYTTETWTHEHGVTTDPDASRYEAAAIDIPGYELVSSPTIEGKMTGQVEKSKTDPNYVKLVFKYKKTMTNEDSPSTTQGNENWGAKISGGWDNLPGMFGYSGLRGLTVEHDNGDVEKKVSDLIKHYENQGYSYVGTMGKVYNKDYYNHLYYGSEIHLIDNKPVTVNYVDEQGNKLADSDTIAFNHDNPDQTNDGINEKTYWHPKGTWTTHAKKIAGYHLVKTLGAETGNFTAYNYITTYVYAQDDVTGSVTYIDDTTTKTLATDPLKGQIGADIDYKSAEKIRDYENKGYKLVSNNFKDGQEKFAKDGNNFEIHLGHDLVPVNPENPGKPGEPINPSDPEGPKYPENTASQDLTHEVKRTVNYVDENGKPVAGSVTETTTMTGSGVLDKVTGEWTTPLTWAEGNFKEINTPSVENYHVTGVTTEGNVFYDVDKTNGNVAKTTVTHENGDTVVTVHFAKDETTGKVTYIDDTTNTTLRSDDLAGKIGEKISYTSADKIKNFEDKGYKLVSTDYQDGKQVFVKDGNKYEIHLVHDLVPVNPEKPGKPGEPINPNDPNGPKYPEKTATSDLTHEVKRTVNYVDENGNPVAGSVTETTTMTGSGVLDKVTGEWTTPLTWAEGSFKEINTPSVENYHVTGVTTEGDVFYNVDKTNGNVSQTTVTHKDGDTVVTVHFAKDVVAANGKVTYIDDTTKTTLKTDDLKGNVGENIDYTTAGSIKDYENKGYKLVSNNFKDGQEKFAKDGNNFEVHLVHDVVPVNPQNPGKPGEPINPNDPEGPKYPEKTSVTDLNKTVTRTVNYVDENGKSISNPVSQKVTLTAKGELDKVTGKWTTPLTWTSDNFDKVTTPEVKGYHVTNVTTDGNIFYEVDKAGNVGETSVDNGKNNTSVTVHFAKDETPVNPETPVTPTPQPQPEPTPEPVEPETPSTPDDVPAPHGEDVPTNPEEDEPSKPEVDQPETVMPHGEDVPTAEPQQTVVKATPVKAETVAASEETVAPHGEELPQTGSHDDSAAAAIGLALVGLTGVMSLAGTRRKRN